MKNGLYLVRVRALDGVDWLGLGVAVLRDGKILGGGSHTYYTGSYSYKDGRVKGELLLNTHTPPPSDSLFYGAGNVGVGVTGTYDDGDEAEWFGTALLRKRSISLCASLRKLAEA
jgi:hypothetical protein